MSTEVRKPEWLKFSAWLGTYLVISGVLTHFVYGWVSKNIGHPASLEVTILLAKAVSLIALVIIGGAEITRSKECPWLLKILTAGVMFCAGVIAVLLVVKIVVAETILYEGDTSQFPLRQTEIILFGSGLDKFPFKPTYDFMSKYGDYVAVGPLFAYAVMNLATVAWASIRSNRNLLDEARAYLLVSDVPCLVPIIGIFLLVGNIEGSFVDRGESARVFVSGAMAMFILTSNLLTLVVRYIVHPALGLDEACSPEGGIPKVADAQSRTVGASAASSAAIETPSGADLPKK